MDCRERVGTLGQIPQEDQNSYPTESTLGIYNGEGGCDSDWFRVVERKIVALTPDSVDTLHSRYTHTHDTISDRTLGEPKLHPAKEFDRPLPQRRPTSIFSRIVGPISYNGTFPSGRAAKCTRVPLPCHRLFLSRFLDLLPNFSSSHHLSWRKLCSGSFGAILATKHPSGVFCFM